MKIHEKECIGHSYLEIMWGFMLKSEFYGQAKKQQSHFLCNHIL